MEMYVSHIITLPIIFALLMMIMIGCGYFLFPVYIKKLIEITVKHISNAKALQYNRVMFSHIKLELRSILCGPEKYIFKWSFWHSIVTYQTWQWLVLMTLKNGLMRICLMQCGNTSNMVKAMILCCQKTKRLSQGESKANICCELKMK